MTGLDRDHEYLESLELGRRTMALLAVADSLEVKTNPTAVEEELTMLRNKASEHILATQAKLISAVSLYLAI